jgi:hypothetical protein
MPVLLAIWVIMILAMEILCLGILGDKRSSS